MTNKYTKLFPSTLIQGISSFNLRPYVCCKCTKTFKTDFDLYNHDKKGHQPVPEQTHTNCAPYRYK